MTSNKFDKNISSKTIKVAVVQHACVDKMNDNQQIVYDGIAQAAKQGANIVLLQELHDHRYFCQQQEPQFFQLATQIPNQTTLQLCHLAKQHQLVIITSVFEQRAKGLYHNTALIIESTGEIIGHYRKMHIPDDPGYYEKYYFAPGEQGFRPIETSVGKLGVMICWDQWFPEAARLMALAGADILFYPSAIGWNPEDTPNEQERQLDAWITIQRSHAIANALPIVVCNRTGFESDGSKQTSGINFWGSSFIADSMGKILTIAPQTYKHDIAFVDTVEIHFSDTEKQRQAWPFLRDRRTDHYTDIVLQYRDKLPR